MDKENNDPAPLQGGCRVSELVTAGLRDASEDTPTPSLVQSLPRGLAYNSLIAVHWFGAKPLPLREGGGDPPW
jgi:hypothetical protein